MCGQLLTHQILASGKETGTNKTSWVNMHLYKVINSPIMEISSAAQSSAIEPIHSSTVSNDFSIAQSQEVVFNICLTQQNIEFINSKLAPFLFFLIHDADSVRKIFGDKPIDTLQNYNRDLLAHLLNLYSNEGKFFLLYDIFDVLYDSEFPYKVINLLLCLVSSATSSSIRLDDLMTNPYKNFMFVPVSCSISNIAGDDIEIHYKSNLIDGFPYDMVTTLLDELFTFVTALVDTTLTSSDYKKYELVMQIQYSSSA